jgi:hypothetical protein
MLRMIGALLSSSAARSLAASRSAGFGAGNSEEKLPLRGSDCECEADEKKQAKQAATQPPAVPPLDTNAILALQGVDAEEFASLKEDPAGTAGQAPAQGQAEGQPTGQEEGQDLAIGTEDATGNPATSTQAEGDEGTNKSDGLSEAEEKQVEKLKERDREVRAHEQAHARAGGGHAGAPSYSYQQGPDGKRYAIGGEVSIDTSAERTAEATIRKMQVVIRAATAPAEPSSQDLKVAQQARAQLQEAQAQVRQERAAEQSGGGDEATGAAGAEGSSASGAGPSAAESGSGQNGASQNGSNGGGDNNRGSLFSVPAGSGSGRDGDDSSSASRAYSDALQLFQQANADRTGERRNGLYA